MRGIFQEIKKYSIIVIVVTAVLGILLMAFPDKMIAYTSIVIGGCFIICGLSALINYAIKQDSKFTLVLGIIAVISGIIICAAYRQIVSVIIFFIGIFLLVGGIVDLINSVDVAFRHFRSWIFTTVLSIASIVLGILSIVNPFNAQNKIVQLIGVGLVLFAVLDLVTFIQIKKVAKEFNKKLDSKENEYNATEVDYREADDD